MTQTNITQKQVTGWIPALSWTHPALSKTAELVSLAGIGGFVLAVALNSVIFSYWGLSFLQLASPSDVIMSGLQVSLIVVKILLSASVGFAVGRAIVWICISRTRLAVVATIVIALAIIGVVVDYQEHGISGVARLPTPDYSLVISFGITAGFMRAVLNRLPGHEQSKKWAERLLLLTWALVGLIALYTYVSALSDVSMLSGERVYIVEPVTQSCVEPIVLWTGDKAIVARCKDNKIAVLYIGQNVWIGSRQAPH